MITPQTVTALPTPLAELSVALLWTALLAFETAAREYTRAELKPAFFDAGQKAARAAIATPSLQRCPSARTSLDAAVAAARGVWPEASIAGLVDADRAARDWLWENPVGARAHHASGELA